MTLEAVGAVPAVAPTVSMLGIAKRYAPSGLLRQLVPRSGYEILIAGAAVLLVHQATGMVHDILSEAAYLVGNVGFSSLPLIDAAGNPTTPPPTPSAGALSATVVAGRLNVRYGPGMGYGIFTVVTMGQSLEVIARDASGIWAKVRLSNGAIAWVSVAYLRVNGNFYALPTANS